MTALLTDVCPTGEYFFVLDEKSVLPGYPKLIKDVWGIKGPIDAAFTRINCQGKTYIFKVGHTLLYMYDSTLTCGTFHGINIYMYLFCCECFYLNSEWIRCL